MKLLFVRNSVTVDVANKDIEALVLSEKGIKVAHNFFKNLVKVHNDIEIIVSSNFNYTKETASILKTYSNCKNLIETDKLNPKNSFEDFIRLIYDLKSRFEGVKTVVFIMDEPNLSKIISKLISNSTINVKLKKPSCLEITYNGKEGELISFLTPKSFKISKKG